MKTYHPKSWSQQAREMCDRQIDQINFGWQTIEEALKFFHTSYKADIIRQRAAKRFGRAIRAGKVHEDLITYQKRFDLAIKAGKAYEDLMIYRFYKMNY